MEVYWRLTYNDTHSTKNSAQIIAFCTSECNARLEIYIAFDISFLLDIFLVY